MLPILSYKGVVGRLFHHLLLMALLAVAQGCRGRQALTAGSELARVGDEILYTNSLPQGYHGLSREDSLRLVQTYVDEWVRLQLLAQYAEEHLGGELPRLERQVHDYRARLYSDAFLQVVGAQEVDTVVTHQELEDCYSKNKGCFVLEEPLVRLAFVKVPAASPLLDDLRRVVKTLDSSEERLQEFSTLTMRAGVLPEFLPINWVLLSRVEELLPKDFTPNWGGRAARNVEVRDGDIVYLLGFSDWIAPGAVKPFEAVGSELKSILIQERLASWRQEKVQALLKEGVSSGFVKLSTE